MEIIIGKTAGFCFGVSNAVNKTTRLLAEQAKQMYCLGELVHNKQVTEELQNKGLKIINDIEEAKENVIIRSHGVTNEVYEKAENMRLKIIDLTCPKVLKIHNIAKEYASKGYYIFLIGNKLHPETIGTISYCGKDSKIIEKEEDIELALQEFNNTNIDKLLVIAQTTFSIEKFNKITKIIEEQTKEKNVEIKKTICDATNQRQLETEKISKEVDLMIIIGGKHSSNTTKLYEISKKHCLKSILVETEQDLEVQGLEKNIKIGIMAGASTPKKSIESVVEKIKQIC